MRLKIVRVFETHNKLKRVVLSKTLSIPTQHLPLLPGADFRFPGTRRGETDDFSFERFLLDFSHGRIRISVVLSGLSTLTDLGLRNEVAFAQKSGWKIEK
jgi:hypothetical protein